MNEEDTYENQDDMKRRWKKEAEQQRKDNKKKQRIVKRREVDITFGGVKPSTPKDSFSDTEKREVRKGDALDDENSRKQLGLD